MLVSPFQTAAGFHLFKLLGRRLANGTKFGSAVSLVNITANRTYKLLHSYYLHSFSHKRFVNCFRNAAKINNSNHYCY